MYHIMLSRLDNDNDNYFINHLLRTVLIRRLIHNLVCSEALYIPFNNDNDNNNK